MKITIEGVKRAPRWETLQTVVKDALDDTSLRMVSVQRQTTGICYSDPGKYRVEYKGDSQGRVVVDLVVSEGTGDERG